jgi:hypothetical protein
MLLERVSLTLRRVQYARSSCTWILELGARRLDGRSGDVITTPRVPRVNHVPPGSSHHCLSSESSLLPHLRVLGASRLNPAQPGSILVNTGSTWSSARLKMSLIYEFTARLPTSSDSSILAKVLKIADHATALAVNDSRNCRNGEGWL